MKELSKKKYVTLITIMILVLGIIGIVNIGNTDLDKGKVKLKSASIEKLKSSVIESKGYEEITYPVLYELEKVEGIEERNVIIKGTLTKEENKYARFKEITSKTITSTVSENGREIEIRIEKVKLGRQNKINIKIEINGAINETKIKPEIEIKEESEKEYTKVNTEEIEVKTNSVTGLVQDEEGMSVSNLELSINKENEEIRRTYTDENGRYVFSDVEEGKYTIKVEEENYELKEVKEVEVIGGITENIIVKKIKPYEIEVKKYISKIKLNNNGKEIEYEYGKLNKVNQTVKNLKNLSGEIEYKIEIKNTGEKSGEITKIEEEVTEGLSFKKEKNSEWEEKNGKIINRSLEGIKLKAGEEKEITLKLDIEKTDEARSYLQKVTAKGEVYQNVVYILDGKEYRKEKVLEGEKIEEPKIVQENFKGWYTDKKYTNKYNFNNDVTKDIILYGKVEESTKKYIVQYIDEGKIIKEEELEEGSIVNAPEVIKEGYTFDGWYEGEEKYDVYEPITRNLILESKYEINKYKVRFINEDGSVLQEETLDYGSTPTYKKETPTKKRTEEYTYEFDKWSPEITKVTGNQEYKATYKETKNKYTATYINEGKEYHKETLEYGNTIKNVENPTKEGYTFIGWYDINDKKVNHPITVTKNMTLYSKYEINSYKVSYYNEGVKYIDDQKINYGENALKPNTNPSKIGYTFKYWSLKENGEKYEFSTKITKDITLYAVYEINKYTVTYINEGIEYHKETAEYGSVVTSIQNPTKEGYTFTGWYTKDNEKVSYPITVTENITLYSKYEINSYKVSYYNEGKKYIDDQKINYGENALKPNTNPSKIGYTFKYWSIKENGEEYEFSTKITKDINLYAVYEINKYTVTYINEGVEYHKETAFYGSVITSIQDPTKEGYTFIGWYNENNEKVTHPITVTENITLHSKYEINTYTVSFYHNNEKYVEDQKVNYGESAVKPSIDPTKEDYNFSGWVIKGTNNKYDFTSKVTKNIELESSFTAKPTYTVTFKIGNEEILTENVIEGHKVTSKEAPYKKGYLFDKWYSDEGLTIENNFDEKIMNNKTIYGKYNENKHTVTYINEGTTYYTEEVLDRFTAKGPSENPSKEGYTFKYFSKDKKVAFDYNAEITENITLYAVYEINKYTVTYINEGSEYHKEELTYKSKHEKIEDPFKTGYTFTGWYNENEEKVEYPIIVTKDITLHSKYEINKYTITFNDEDRITTKEVNYNNKVEPVINQGKTGYTFKYWSIEKGGKEYNFNTLVTENMTLYAVYEINKYTVTYINEGSEYHKEELTYKSKHEKIEDPFKTGYTFTGWYNENEEKVEYPIIVTKDITLHSKYEINKYTITFNDEDRITTKEVNYNNKVEPVINQGKTGYTFKYWSIEKGGKEYNFNTLVTENITLYAVYNINKYTVTFKNYDGSTLQEETLEYRTLPKYKGEAPTREKTKEYTYTFKGWDKEITEVTDNEIYIATYTETKNKYTVIYMDGEREYTRKEVNYGETVSEEVINKDHNIYRGWTLEGNIYDFNTPVTNNITIKSSFELVESPIIESTPIEWTKENVKVTITTNHNDYSYMYKIDDGEYQNYNGEFTVDKNCTVIAKSIKENVESEVTTKEITNIDKVLPEIKEITEENITTKSFDIKVKGQDNESGLSEIRIYKNEELMVSYPYTERLNEEKEETYSLTGLEENTTYKIKVELIDKVGNKNVSEEKEITTLKRVIVSRIIGRNNSLYESEAEYELFESLEEAITACGSNECTIEMVLDTKESVNVLEGQEIKLELNGKTVTGVRDYTIENSGELIITDKEETEGGIINNTDIAIKNIENGILQIGENEEPLSVSTTKPNIVGTTYGIYTEEETSKLKFYDGKIEGNVAIQGNVDDTPYLYNAKITNEGHQVATLSILAEAEAKITGGKYYTKLSNAVSETKSGPGTYTDKEENLLQSAYASSYYTFNYDEETNSLVSNNQNQRGTTAYSYIKIDLTDYTVNQELTVSAKILASNGTGCVHLNTSKENVSQNTTDGRLLYMTGNQQDTAKVILQKGKIYYLHFSKSRSWTDGSSTDIFSITDVTLNDYKVNLFGVDILDDIVTPGTYGFVNEFGKLKSNNKGTRYTSANSYLKVDLTNYVEDQKIYIDAEISSREDNDFGYVTITDNETIPEYNSETGRVVYISGDVSSKVYEATLTAGKINYIHIGYKKTVYYGSGLDTFTINGIYTSIDKGDISQNITTKVPVLNEKVDTVELIKDITLASKIEIPENKEMVLDLKGYTLTTSSNDYVIKNSGDLTIIDSKYSDEQDKNQSDYEAEQAKYDEEYNAELSAYNKAKKDYEKSVEEYNKKLEEYYASHPGDDFEYTGEEGTYVVPQDGTYELETWGAQGGTAVDSCDGGYGGYSYGQVELKKGDILYINVGGVGTCNVSSSSKGGYNGGGDALSRNNYKMCSGGGATHIATKSGLLKTLSNSTDSILIVSGSGGGFGSTGSSCSSKGGSGGGISGTVPKNNCSDCGTRSGGTQTSGGRSRFGTGGFGFGAGSTTSYSVGGGSGFYGGAGDTYEWGAAGGSGYIGNSKLTNKKMYCYDCTESSDESTKTISTTNVSEIPTENNAKKGNGYAKITLLGSNNSDSTIEKPTKPEEPEILKTTDVELETSNFTYSGNGRFTKGSSNLNFYVNNSGNKSVTYYNKKINVTSKTYAHVNLSLYQNYYSDGGLLGTAYIGFSKTNEANTDDFVSYVEKDITSYSGKATPEDINIPIEEPGEYYFKIVLYHNSNTSSYTVYSDLYSLSFDHKPVLKKAILKKAAMTGTIISTTNSVIYNDLGASLVIKDGNMVLNKSGEYDIITNEGNISLFKDVVLNTKQANNRAIYNGYKGIIKNANMVINQDSSGYGIYNYSSFNNNFEGSTFNLSSGYAIFNRQSTLTVNNINVNGGTAYSNDSNLIINNSNLSTKIRSTGNVEFNNTTLKYISGSSSDYVFNGIITINNSTFNLPWFLGNYNVDNSITINNSDINVNSSIGRIKNLYINNSTFNSISTQYNWNAIDNVTNLVINNSIVNSTVGRSEYNVIGNCENVEIKGETVINNSYEGNTISATNITVGEKDNKSSDYPKIQNGTGSGLKTNNLNIYDGTITTKKGLSILGSITEIEDSYKVNVVYNEDGTETLSLVEPTDVVAKIGEKTYTKLGDALAEVSDNETIYLLKNVYPIEAFTLSESKIFKIDLNSNEIRGFNSDKLFENAGTHEIIDSVNENKGTISNSGSYVLINNGTLNSNNVNVSSRNNLINNYGSIKLDNTDVSASGGYLINNDKDGIIESTSSVFNVGTINNSGSIKLNDVTINNSIITNNENATLSLLKSRLENHISDSNKGITNSGVLTTEDCALKFYYGYVLNNATGTYTTTNDTYTGVDDRYSSIQSNGILNVYGISTWNRIINRTDGLLNIYSGSYHIVNAYDNSKTNIYGGTLNGYISNEGANSVLNINAGTFNWGSTGSSSYVIENRSTGTVNIGVKDGTVDNDSIKISSTQKGLYNNTGTLNFYDGIVKGVTAIQGKVNDVEDGYDIVKETDGNLEVKYLGKVYAAQIESTGEKYYSIKEAIDAVTKDDEIIKLLRNITTFTTAETIEISDNKNVILDLNGYTINQGNKPLINNNGTLTLRDSSDTTTDSYGNVKYKGQIITSNGTIINNNGSFIFESGTITSDVQVDNLITNTNNMTINNGYVTVSGRSSDLIINSGILTINDGRFCTEDFIQSIVNNKVGATLTINGGKYYKNGDGIEITNEGTAYIYGGNFTAIENLIYNKETGVAKIDGLTGVSVEWLTNYGTMDISNSSIGENYMYNYATLNLTNVTLLYGSIQNSNDVGEININGGTYNGEISANSGKLSIIDGTFNKTIRNWRGTVNIRGGKFASGVNNSGSGTINIGTKGDITDSGELNVSTDNPNITNTTYGVINTNGGIVNFYDGIISGTTDAINGTINEVEDGYEIISDTTDDGKKSKYLSRLPVAEVESTGDTYYTLQEAIDAATNSKEVIKLLRRFTTLNTLETTKISEDKDIILDLNGYTLEQNNENFLSNNGTLKITDSSEDNLGKIVMYTNKSIENNGVMVIENINISVNKALSNLINNNDSLKVNNVKINSSNNISNFINNSGVLEMNVGEYSISNGTFIYNLSSGSITMDSITTTGNNYLIIVNNSGTSNNVKILNSNFSGRVINSESGTIVIDNLVSTSEVNNNKTGVINISNSNIRSVYNSNGIVDLNTVTVNGISAEGSGTTNINGMILNSGSIVNRNSHVINIYDASVENNWNAIYNNNAGSIINIYGGSFNSTKQNTVSNTGTINIYGGTITSTTGNSITNTGTVNIGSKDGNVSTEMPIITGKTYGVSNGDSGKVNFYDGIVSGESGAFSGTINEVEPGYKIVTNKTDTLTSATLTLVGDDEKVAVLNGINFTSLQDAINSASDTNESIITLYKDVTFESNITVPANKNIKLYLNGYILNKGSYDFTGEGKITVIDGTSTNALASIMESVKEVLNIEGIKKNIIIYEMDDGSAISSESTYKLYKDNEEVILEEDAIGIYSVGNSNDEIRSANNKIYINELPKGKYKLIGDNNKEVKFEIDESGKVIGNVKENTKGTRKLVSTAVAELIIMIQTGIEKVNYIMIILTLLVTISSLLYIVKKTNVKES